MDNKNNNLDFNLEDILREFSDHPEEIVALDGEGPVTETVAQVLAQTEAIENAMAEAARAEEEALRAAEEAARAEAEAAAEAARAEAEAAQAEQEPEAPAGEAPVEEAPAEPVPAGDTEAEAAQEAAAAEEPVEEVHIPGQAGDAPKRPPLVLRPRTRLQALKKEIVAGPEKRYYALTEIGLGRVQLAMLANFFIVLLCAGATFLYAMDMIPDNRMRLMVFSQVLAMLVSALLGCYVLMDGIADLLKLRFSLNTMLFLTFLVCCADAVFCLRELRVPCCAAFSLEMGMALYNRYLSRVTELGQMDTLRKAVLLDSLARVPDYHDGREGLIRGNGHISDFMDNYQVLSGPERAQGLYAFIALFACGAIGGFTGILHGVSMGIQILATSMLVAVPGSFFIALSKPAATLEKRLHMVGTVICGWQGVKGLCKAAAFPLRDRDIFPTGAAKLNGVKFYSDRDPDETVSYAGSLMTAEDTGLAPLFHQLLKNRNCEAYEVENFIDYPNGGIGGEVRGEPVLMGTLNFLQSMGVDIPDGTMVNQAVYCAIDGQLSAVFAISYAKMKSAAAGLVTLCGSRRLSPVLVCGDFMVDESFLRSKFGINTRRISFPDPEVRRELRQRSPDEETVALALTIQDSLASTAYAVSGARALRTASRLGLIVHIFAGTLGLLTMAALAILGSQALLTPFNVLLYQLVWLLPGLLISSWTRTV